MHICGPVETLGVDMYIYLHIFIHIRKHISRTHTHTIKNVYTCICICIRIITYLSTDIDAWIVSRRRPAIPDCGRQKKAPTPRLMMR